MLKAELEDLIRNALLSLGATELERNEGVTRYQLVDGLVERMGREELLITFSSSVAGHRPDVELISAGSFLYDLILRLARERGRAAGAWLAPRTDLNPPELIVKLVPRLADRRFSRQKATWGASYLFSYRLGFYFDTPHEKFYTVRIDLDRGRVRHELHPDKLIEGALSEPPDPEVPVAPTDPERAFRMAWGKVEEEVERLTEKYRQQGESHLQDEIRTIEHYYRQLIEEEKRSREQKNTRRGRDESDQRIELLKLEWDRRIAEEKNRMSPEVSVVLSCASCLRVPLEKWRARAGRGPREAAADFWVDLHSGEAWPARTARKKGKAEKADRKPRLKLVEGEPSPSEGDEPEPADPD
jgi:hypothetical protein